MSRAQRLENINWESPALPVTRQCELLDLSRSTVYYDRQCAVSAEDESLMLLIDKVHLRYPFYGSRRIVVELKNQGLTVNRKRVQRLMRVMGLEALYPRPRTSIANKAHLRYPYLLKNVDVDRPNQAWASDITYIPMRKGFLHLVVIMDWYSRAVLSYRVSNTMDSDFCREALDEALERYGQPEIFNTDQGCQFTSDHFLEPLKERKVNITLRTVISVK